MAGNREIKGVWLGSGEAVNAFRALFPELVERRGLTRLPDDVFASWNEGKNEVVVELDRGEPAEKHVPYLAVGGPSALTAALLHQLTHKPGASQDAGNPGLSADPKGGPSAG